MSTSPYDIGLAKTSRQLSAADVAVRPRPLGCRPSRAHRNHSCPGAGPNARVGAVAFIHRFGFSLNLHTHSHVCVIDGVFESDAQGGVRFYPVDEMDVSDAEAMQGQERHRILRAFVRRGILDKDERKEMTGGTSLDATLCIAADDRNGCCAIELAARNLVSNVCSSSQTRLSPEIRSASFLAEFGHSQAYRPVSGLGTKLYPKPQIECQFIVLAACRVSSRSVTEIGFVLPVPPS